MGWRLQWRHRAGEPAQRQGRRHSVIALFLEEDNRVVGHDRVVGDEIRYLSTQRLLALRYRFGVDVAHGEHNSIDQDFAWDNGFEGLAVAADRELVSFHVSDSHIRFGPSGR